MELCESQSKHYRNSIAIKPNVINTPSIFTIEHILSKAGPLKETSPTFAVAADATGEARDRQHLHSHSVSDKSLPLDCHLEQFNQLPPILDWLQYTRYKPPRLPRPARNGPVKRTPGRLPRIPFSTHQLNELESAYKRANYLSSEDANKLAAHLDLTCMRVKIWFQNRRARERRERRDLDGKASPTA